MSRLPRPFIPFAIRVQVAERQAREEGHSFLYPGERSKSKWLADLLLFLFGYAKVHLDHDPPLGAREKIMRGGEIVGYRPAANDPESLVYRLAVDHQIKTNVRGLHGQHPDRVLIKKQRRRERPQSKRRKAKIAQPNNFKWPSRPFNRNRPSSKLGNPTTKEPTK